METIIKKKILKQPLQLNLKKLRVFLIAFLITTTVRIASAQTSDQPHFPPKKLNETPTIGKLELILPSGPTTVDSESIMYDVFGRRMPTQITIFRDPQTKQFWVGPHYYVYVATAHGIIGFRPGAGAVYWSKPMMKIDPGISSTNLHDIWKLIDEKVDSEMLSNLNSQVLFSHALFQGGLDEKFPWLLSASCSLGSIKINSITLLGNNDIQIDISSPDREHRAIGIFDDQTLELKKATLDGKQVFPNSELILPLPPERLFQIRPSPRCEQSRPHSHLI
ncbi:hypothetical protein [Pedosphaera parvula]|uniref:Uncharacterized protein n=1 Tax=Pedosphaera parvula (strain Ellin514) TaxID=320771 RepID=B9XQA4_PEDPL|nr:hypothetical protein [Pedosphaera parvula]EEF57928.1 hypothetical protein Cflav_PD1103 [Pedosphaera parvula Ellin514]